MSTKEERSNAKEIARDQRAEERRQNKLEQAREERAEDKRQAKVEAKENLIPKYRCKHCKKEGKREDLLSHECENGLLKAYEDDENFLTTLELIEGE
jgi:ribosomal protein L44E